MSLEWARARALQNAARLASDAERQARSKVVQRPIGPLLSWRPSCAQPGRSAADNLLSAREGGHKPKANGQGLPGLQAIAPEGPVSAAQVGAAMAHPVGHH